MNPPRKTTGLFLTPRGPYGRRLPERARNHMQASENRGTIPKPTLSESFRLARPQNQNAAPTPVNQPPAQTSFDPNAKPQLSPQAQQGLAGQMAPRSLTPQNPKPAFDPNATLYRVKVNPKTNVAEPTPISPQDIKAKNASIFVNGIANDPKEAAKLGISHTGKSDFYMIHNPTNGMLSDLGESARQKLGFRTDVANSTRDLLRHFDLPTANVTSHSQGTMIVNSALGDLLKQGKDMRGLTLNYHGAAANSLVSGALAHRIGAHINEFTGHPLDPVHNIIGMNTLNPLRIAGSVLGSGLIFSKDPDVSSHSKPNGQAKRLGPIFQTHVFDPLMPTHYD